MDPASPKTSWPVVSVIITSYNYGHFLAEAIESVRQQTYLAREIVVVDDGSTDNTREVATAYPEVVYVYQHNQGLSAARNTGIRQSKGQYLVFLDADDWLFPDALAFNVSFLQHHPQAAFVSGAHTRVYADEREREPITPPVSPNPYYRLLSLGNYIAMISAVMFARWALKKFEFDVTLRNCEDYDIYLNITRHYPILQHGHQLAAYRIHRASMSTDTSQMLDGALKVLNQQRQNLRSPLEIEAYTRGVHCWTTYFSGGTDFKLVAEEVPDYPATMHFFRRYAPLTGWRYTLRHQPAVAAMSKHISTASDVWTCQGGMLAPGRVGKVAPGAFNRRLAFSPGFGCDPCWPIERQYIAQFRQQESAHIQGLVLEMQDFCQAQQESGLAEFAAFTPTDDSPPEHWFKSQFSEAANLPNNTFDCVLFTHSLHLAYDFRDALQTCYRVLKPGGTLLLTVPGVGEWKDTWYWSFTPEALLRLLAKVFPGVEAQLESYGNVYVAAAYLYGLELPEISPEKLHHYDPEYQVLHTVKVVKS
ncbi:glycosyltransferase [Hymenobacter wooponensis]|uniref:Glycosyltransferase n=1 Tax=Hymenobacter wooponensis TaxID=1525360 RepID=A0A4Z0MII7_9BACT|nr:glycosyltransferase [Hymenobacter wooponensis]TGD79632.1 glycosyltransferase [Hymenobacter wooponensis]